MKLTPYENCATAFSTLLHPLVEVVIHDLKTQKICFITGGLKGSLSQRKIGDPSLLDTEKNENFTENIPPYSKINFDGRLIKSLSLPIQENGETIALMCINVDISVFEQVHQLTSLLLETNQTEHPESLFKNDWQERIHKALHGFLKEKEWIFQALTTAQKKIIIHHFYNQGAFEEKNAADYIAKILSLSRATIFNALRTLKTPKN